MSSLHLQLGLWISQPILQTIIGVALYRRKLHKQFPAFFVYTVAQIILCAISFGVHASYSSVYLDSAHNYSLYFVMYYSWAALKDLGTALFKWAAMIMILVSVVMVSMSPGWDDPVRRTIRVVQLCVDVIQCGLLIFLLAFSQNLGVSWRRLSFGVALGFGLASCTELLTHALHSGLHIRSMTTSLIDMTAYEAGLLLWLGYSAFCKYESAVPVLVPQRWDDALTDIQPQNEAESLIPMFEHMVEQAFSKTQDQSV